MMGGIAAAARMHEIEPFHVMAILARARELEAAGRDIVHMEIGEPDFITPAPIIAAGQQALAEGKTHYTPALGLPALRTAIAGYYKSDFGLDIDPGCVCVTPGASGALQLLLGALVGPRDQVLMADPGYPCNRHFVRMFEAEPVAVEVDAESGFQPTLDQLKAHRTANTKAVLLASPSNPTGTSLTPDALHEILEWVVENRLYLIVDEIYAALVYGRAADTALSVAEQLGPEAVERLFVVNSFSKYFGMTGWRLGWLVAPKAWIWTLDRLAQNIFLSASTPSQYAALAAFRPETRSILEQRRLEFGQRRDALLPALQQLGFEIRIEPDGAFYLYADCQAFSEDSDQLAMRCLEEGGVALTPGRDFGQFGARTHLRFAYTQPVATLQQGVDRLRALLT